MKNEEGRVKSEMSNPFVTPQQRAYILAHLNDRPRTAVARAAGVSTATLYRIVRQAGGELLHERATRRPEAEERREKDRFTPPEGYTSLTWYQEVKRRAAAGDAEAQEMLRGKGG